MVHQRPFAPAIPYQPLKAFSRLAGLHPFVQHDGPVSIARAFVPRDWRRMCAAAGLPNERNRRLKDSHRPAVRRTKETRDDSTSSTSIENLVIGGGLAGSMVAMRLAAAGREVVLLEKEREAHHKVCGEFLSRRGHASICGRAAIEPCNLGAHAIQPRAISLRPQDRRRPPSLHRPLTCRDTFWTAMLCSSQEAGCEVRRGACVERSTRPGGYLARSPSRRTDDPARNRLSRNRQT